MKKYLLFSGLVFCTLIISYLLYDFFYLSNKTSISSKNDINEDIINFEDNFFEFLNERFDQLFAENESQLEEKSLILLANEAISLIKKFETDHKNLNVEENDRINQLKFYTYSKISIDVEKSKKILAQISPSVKKLSLLKNYISTFTPFISETKMNSYLEDQLVWVEKYDNVFKSNIKILMFLASPIGKKFPDFLPEFKDINNNKHNLAKFKGKYVLIDFWATWCTPCLAELPYLIDGYNKYGPQGKKSKNKFEIISISLDYKISVLKKFLSERNIKWIQYGDGNSYNSPIVKKYQVISIPTLYLLDMEGTVIKKNLSGKKLLQILNQEITN